MLRKHELCPVSGCGKASHGKPYCVQHMTVGSRRTLPKELRSLIRSHCCDAKCVSGKAHDSGEQYCAKCKEPCLWKTPR